MSRSYFRGIIAGLAAALGIVASGSASAALCGAGISSRLEITVTSTQCLITYKNSHIHLSSPESWQDVARACDYGYNANPGCFNGYCRAPDTLVSTGNNTWQMRGWFCYAPNTTCTYGGPGYAGSFYEGNIGYVCGASTCPDWAGTTKTLATADNTPCIDGCTWKSVPSGGTNASSLPGSVCVTIGLNSGNPISTCKYTVPTDTTQQIACSTPSAEGFKRGSDATGNVFEAQENANPKLNGVTMGGPPPLPAGSTTPTDASGYCQYDNGGWVDCWSRPWTSPPLPNTGTYAVVATPDATVTDNATGGQWVTYTPAQASASTSGFGGSPSGGSGSGPGSGGAGDPNCTGTDCNNALSGGGSCASAPVCTGDPIGCFTALQAWKQACALTGGSEAQIKSGADLGIAAGNPAGLERSSNVATALPTPSASSCALSNISFTALGHTFSFPLTMLCPYLVMFGKFLLIAASILGFKIVSGGVL